MTKPLRRLWLAPLLSAGLLVAATAPALAGSASLSDATGDYFNDHSGTTTQPRNGIDITRVKVTVGPSNVYVRIDMRDVRIPSTTERQNYQVNIANGRDQPVGSVNFSTSWTRFYRGTSTSPSACSIGKTISASYDYVQVKVPRSCMPSATYFKAIGMTYFSRKDYYGHWDLMTDDIAGYTPVARY